MLYQLNVLVSVVCWWPLSRFSVSMDTVMKHKFKINYLLSRSDKTVLHSEGKIRCIETDYGFGWKEDDEFGWKSSQCRNIECERLVLILMHVIRLKMNQKMDRRMAIGRCKYSSSYRRAFCHTLSKEFSRSTRTRQDGGEML